MEAEATLGRPSRFGQCYASGVWHAIRIALGPNAHAPFIPDGGTAPIGPWRSRGRLVEAERRKLCKRHRRATAVELDAQRLPTAAMG
jgi:hypothetical protein